MCEERFKHELEEGLGVEARGGERKRRFGFCVIVILIENAIKFYKVRIWRSHCQNSNPESLSPFAFFGYLIFDF